MKNGVNYSIQNINRKIEQKYNNLRLIIIYFLFNFIKCVSISEKLRKLNNYFSEIHLIVQAEGKQSFLSEKYNDADPYEIILNGKDIIDYIYDLGKGKNNITLKFDTDIENCKYMFGNLENIIEIDLSNFDASHVSSISSMFKGCTNLEKINFGNINTSSIKDMGYLFDGCSKIRSIDLLNFDNSQVTCIDYMFNGCINLEEINFGRINMSSIDNLKKLINGCDNLKSLDLSNLDFSKISYSYSFVDLRLFHNLVFVNLSNTNLSTLKDVIYFCDESSNLKSINLSNLDFSSVTDMSYMFEDCSNLEEINLGNINASSLKKIKGLFSKCSKITSIDLSNFDFSSVTDISYMFEGCSNIENINFDNLNTSSIKNMNSLFSGCSKITSIDLSHFDFSSVTDMSFMFEGCSNLENINFGNINTNAVKKLKGMIYGCSKIVSIDLSNFDVSKVTDISYMFEGCSNLEQINFGKKNISSIKNLNSLFSGCSKLTSLDLSNFDLSLITNMAFMFEGCINLEKIKFGNIAISSVNNMNSLFSECSKITSIDLSNFDFSSCTDMSFMFHWCFNLENINFGNINTTAVKNMNSLFSDCWILSSIDLSNFDFSSVTDMSSMFNDCINLENINFGNINTTAVKNMNSLFFCCWILSSIDLSNFDFSSVTDMSSMFEGCSNLENINFGNINTSSIKNMNSLFSGCSKIRSIDLSLFDFSSVTYMSFMFEGCSNLENINFGNTNTSSLEYMLSLFNGCSKISSIDLSNFDTSKVIYMTQAFFNCYNLLYLDLSHFNTTSVISIESMFYGCKSLIYLNLYSFNFTGVFYENTFYGLPSYTKYCIKDYDTAKYLLNGKNKTSDCSHFCFKKDKKLDFYNKTCTDLCISNKILYEYNNICYLKCPRGTLVNNGLCEDINCEENNNDCLNKIIPENYYYDPIDQLYKKCFYTCKKCNGHGNKIYHNCLECKHNFTFLNDSMYSTNCYKKCEYYFYFDEYNIYRCTKNYVCPERYNKLILDKKKCINKCKNDNIYQYEFENKCLLSCPNETLHKENDKICYKKHFIESTIIQDIKQTDKEIDVLKTDKIINTTVTNEIDEINETIKFNYTLTTDMISLESGKNINEKIEKFRNYILNINISENNEDKIEIIDGVLYQITTTENQKIQIKNNNISTIVFPTCELLLKSKYNIDKSLPLIILKIDYFPSDSLIPIIAYEIYHPLNKSKLNLKYCEGNKININIPVSIDENKLFMYDINSNYYNDKCFIHSTEKKTDIILQDRRQEFIDKKLFLCESDCNYTGYDKDNKQSLCICNITDKMNFISEIINNPNGLLNNSVNIKLKSGYSNLNTFKCLKILFSKKSLKKNISSYLIIFIIVQFIISDILFFKFDGFNLLEKDIDNILKEKENNDWNINEIITEGNLQNNKRKINKKLIDIPKILSLSVNNENQINDISNNFNSAIKFNSLQINKDDFELNKKGKYIENNEIVNKKESINKINIELNSSNYEKSINYDKRTIFEYYLFLIKRKNIIFFTFFHMNDYNNIIIKLCIFSLSFSIYYTINFLFCNEKIIHNIYKNDGKYDILYFLPNILISFILSYIFTRIIQYLFLSDRFLIKIKKQKTLSLSNELSKKVKKDLYLKYILFFIFSFILFIFLWILLSSFSAVYQNTQIILLYNTLISFAINNIYSLAFYVIPAFIRIKSLNSKNKDKRAMFKISKYLEML